MDDDSVACLSSVISCFSSLEAALLQKREEYEKLKLENKNKSFCYQQSLKKSIPKKSNDGVEARNAKDILQNEEDFDLLAKSREMLEAKSHLYNKLEKEKNKSKYLVDFQKKMKIEKLEARKENDPPSEKKLCGDEYSSALTDNSSDLADDLSDQDEWVEFVDALGRTRRCLRENLPLIKSEDDALKKELNPSPESKEEHLENVGLCSVDAHREAMRKKWEEQETKLMNKTEVHYQDVLFDEARTHGVGYYNFSSEEGERRRQQEFLNKLRQDTTKQQAEVEALRAKRDHQIALRVAAARKRRRERMGLPPEEPEPEVGLKVEEAVKEVVAPVEEKIEDMEEALKRAAYVRPWDIGKDGVKAPKVMSQEEWVEKKREERPEEFAPPVYPEPAQTESPPKRKPNTLFFTSKKQKTATKMDLKPRESAQSIITASAEESLVSSLRGRGFDNTQLENIDYRQSSVPQRGLDQKLEMLDSIDLSSVSAKTCRERNLGCYKETSGPKLVFDDSPDMPSDSSRKNQKKGAEIPPPPTMEYYGGSSTPNHGPAHRIDLEDSISAGLSFLRKKVEEKQKKSTKDFFKDI